MEGLAANATFDLFHLPQPFAPPFEFTLASQFGSWWCQDVFALAILGFLLTVPLNWELNGFVGHESIFGCGVVSGSAVLYGRYVGEL
jgi:hypothetical protein